MRISSLLLVCFLLSIVGKAQDAYHSSLQNNLRTNFDLPNGSWLLNDTEEANLNADYTWGTVHSADASASGQPFSKKVTLTVNGSDGNQWDAGYGIQNVRSVGAGSICLLVVWLRSEGESGQISLYVENSTSYEKEVYLTFDLSGQWTQYLVPFDANQTYPPGGLSIGLHLAWKTQKVEIGGLAALNYGTGIAADDLPNQTNNDQYGGWEADAPWRAEAADRIEMIRKADLTVRVETAEGEPLAGAAVEVKMLRHEFAFGSAVVSRLFAGNNGHNNTYETKLLDLDGKGHGFNWVVFENALKWPGWEQNWITTKPETANAVQWLRNHDIRIRGHNIIWPGWPHLPSDIEDNQHNPDYIKRRINEHIEEIITYPGIQGAIAEWDVLNEITTNRDLENALKGKPGYPTGREIYPEIFEKLTGIDPDIKTYVNDYVTISQANTDGGLYDLKKQFIREITDAGARVDGVGFQAHIGGFPTSIYDVQSILDDFYRTFGTTARITEYDTNEAIDDDLAAIYLRDFLTMVFSHKSTSGFLMWGFWDGAHWQENAPLFYRDWSLKPAGEAFIDLVFNQWWTEEQGFTDANGAFRVRGFKGLYQITVDCGDRVLVDTIELRNDMVAVKKNEDLVTGLDPVTSDAVFQVYPNPAHDYLVLGKEGNSEAEVRIFDMIGRPVYTGRMTGSRQIISLDFGKGVFEVVVTSGNRRSAKKILIE